MPERIFTLDDQVAFARISGDHNPVHIDPLAARRTMFGRVVVHGIHAVLHGLEVWLAGSDDRRRLTSLRASFPRAIGLGEAVRHGIESPPAEPVEIQMSVREAPAVWIEAGWSADDTAVATDVPRRLPPKQVCRAHVFADIVSASGSIDLCFPEAEVAALFPRLARALSPAQIATILATTRLVGMECPGLHSVFGGLNLAFSGAAATDPVLEWRVGRSDERLSRIAIDVRSPGMSGSLTTFLRPQPARQATSAALRAHVRDGEFRGQRALVIGGSRGLGEVVAKLLAAGGASVRITYNRGAEDAARVVGDITGSGGIACCGPLDILHPPESVDRLFGEGWSPTHLYFFATPPILPGVAGSFSEDLFREFCGYYVTAFFRIVRMLRDATPGLFAVFYPSSIYVEEPPSLMAEYAAAKAAGEVVAATLERATPGFVVDQPRLPRLATDQTATFVPVTSGDPVPVLLHHLRAFSDRAAPSRPTEGG